MELVSLRCNRDFTSASSYGLGWYKYAIATQWYQFHTTDAWWFSLKTLLVKGAPGHNDELGSVSISEKTSYSKIFQSLEAARFVFKIVRSLWNLTGTSAALLPRRLSNFKAMWKFKLPISRLRDFTRSYDKTSYRILKRDHVVSMSWLHHVAEIPTFHVSTGSTST